MKRFETCFAIWVGMGFLFPFYVLQEAHGDQPNPPIVRGFVGGNAAGAKSWGANVVRIFMNKKGEIQPQISKLQEIRKMGGMKAILCTTAPAKWDDPSFGESLAKKWRDVVTQLKPYRDVIWGYDLLNEPLDRKQLPRAPKQWRDVAIQVIKAIREVDDQTWIVYEVGPSGRFTGFEGLEPLPDSRVIYSAHYYLPHEFSHQGVKNLAGTPLTEVMKNLNAKYPMDLKGSNANTQGELGAVLLNTGRKPEEFAVWDKNLQRIYLKPAVDFQKKYHVPIYVGEFSAVSWADPDSLTRYLSEAVDLFEEYGWSWTYHAFQGAYVGWDPCIPEGPQYYAEVNEKGYKRDKDRKTRRSKLLQEWLKKNASE